MLILRSLTGVIVRCLPLLVCLPIAAFERPPPEILICYNYSCNRAERVSPDVEDWKRVADQFKPAARSPLEDCIDKSMNTVRYQ